MSVSQQLLSLLVSKNPAAGYGPPGNKGVSDPYTKFASGKESEDIKNGFQVKINKGGDPVQELKEQVLKELQPILAKAEKLESVEEENKKLRKLVEQLTKKSDVKSSPEGK